jgi:hypothetical protein
MDDAIAVSLMYGWCYITYIDDAIHFHYMDVATVPARHSVSCKGFSIALDSPARVVSVCFYTSTASGFEC